MNPTDVPCPMCRAKAGEMCQNIKGFNCSPHSHRIRAACGEPYAVRSSGATPGANGPDPAPQVVEDQALKDSLYFAS